MKFAILTLWMTLSAVALGEEPVAQAAEESKQENVVAPVVEEPKQEKFPLSDEQLKSMISMLSAEQLQGMLRGATQINQIKNEPEPAQVNKIENEPQPAQVNQIVNEPEPVQVNQIEKERQRELVVEPPMSMVGDPVTATPPMTMVGDPVTATPPATMVSPPHTTKSPPVRTPPSVNGDPHFTMFSGRKYDFHGACDLVFIDNPDYNNGQGMKIHIRTKIVRWWSFVESVVVRIGDDTLEMMGGVDKKQYWVNGKPGPTLKDSGPLPFTIGGHTVRLRVMSDNTYQLKILLGNDVNEQSIILRAVKNFMKVDIQHHDKETFGTSKGLLGSYEGGRMLARDGKTEIDDADKFGREWQVREYEPMLFHNVEGTQHPEVCAMPTTTSRRLGESSISRAAAAKACRKAGPDKKDCIFDVMATGDLDMAEIY